MSIYLSQLVLALVAVYIVEVSGFTQSWRDALAHFLHLPNGDHLKPLPPFDCGKCATFWACCILALSRGEFSLLTLATACGFSLLAKSFADAMGFIIDILARFFDIINPYGD